MKIPSLNFAIGVTVLFLSSCSNAEKTAQAPASNAVIESTASTSKENKESPKAKEEGKTKKEHSGKGGQVVESGAYHLELVPEKTEANTILELYVQKGDDHQAIPDAKVSGEVQYPDGQVKPVTFVYEDKEKHYEGTVPGKAAGSYQLKITTAVGKDKVDGRFNFDR